MVNLARPQSRRRSATPQEHRHIFGFEIIDLETAPVAKSHLKVLDQDVLVDRRKLVQNQNRLHHDDRASLLFHAIRWNHESKSQTLLTLRLAERTVPDFEPSDAQSQDELSVATFRIEMLEIWPRKCVQRGERVILT